MKDVLFKTKTNILWVILRSLSSFELAIFFIKERYNIDLRLRKLPSADLSYMSFLMNVGKNNIIVKFPDRN